MGPLRALVHTWFFSSTLLFANYSADISRIKLGVDNPEHFLKNDGQLVVMGNASLDKAKIIFLPEIHDDPKSLMTQLALIAREKERNRPFIVLDESLASLKKSKWDVFSQKTLEIIAAQDQRRQSQVYVPRQFEIALQNLANKFRSEEGHLQLEESTGLWALSDFAHEATPFYGWDTADKSTLAERNEQMVVTLKRLLGNHDRILVMAGARHVPELEFMTSQRLLCGDSKLADMNQFFGAIKKNFGRLPNLKNGIGATSPIHEYLEQQPYAVVFNKALYGELDRIVNQFKSRLGPKACLKLALQKTES